MPDYAKMYQKLFRAQTKAIDILREAQQDAEEIYLSAPEVNVTLLETRRDDGKPDPEE